jgi:hypothetical protein
MGRQFQKYKILKLHLSREIKFNLDGLTEVHEARYLSQ